MSLRLEKPQVDTHASIAISMATGPATVNAQNRALAWVASYFLLRRQKLLLAKFGLLKHFKRIMLQMALSRLQHHLPLQLIPPN